jgi:MFS family permease
MTDHGDAQARERAVVRRTVLAAASIAAFLTPFMSSGINIGMPAIGRELDMSAVSLGWVATAYQLTAAMFLVPFGRLADIVGRKRIFGLGLAVNMSGSALAALARTGWALILFRGLQGVGGAMIFGTGIAMLTSVYPAGERGRALGINTAATYLGLSLGPVLGGFLVRFLGWRSIFWVNIPLAASALLIVLLNLRGDWAESRGERFDWQGSLVFGLGLVALMTGFSRLPSTIGAALTAGGLVLLALFIRHESRVESPVLDVGLFRGNRVFAFSNLAALVNYSATFAVGFLLSLYLQYIKALPPHSAGFVLLAQPAVMALASPFAGRLSDRVEPRIIASLGMALTSLGLLALSFLRPWTPLPVVLLMLGGLGLGFGLFSSPNTNAVMGSVERRNFGVASATLGTMRLSGQMFNAGTTMMIFALFLGGARIVPELYPVFLKAMKTAFFLYACICFAGVFASLARGNRPVNG